MTHTLTFTPDGPFSLAASTRFLEGFAPAAYDGGAGDDGPLRLAFPVEGSWRPVGVVVRQRDDGTVIATYEGDAPVATVRRQVARILSLDIDGGGFAAVGRRDPVVQRLQAAYPGLRPVCFHSPYEAAAWAIIGQRLRIVQAARVKARLAEQHGTAFALAGQTLHSFPAPDQLLGLGSIDGINDTKVERLHGVARAAQEGLLDGERLRALSPEAAQEAVEQINGIGPFSSSLVVIRGAGAPDAFPATERRLHDSMRSLYGRPSADVEELTGIADAWRPYRSWVALLIRTEREDRTGEIAGGARTRTNA
jgi:3-methyladenine DNA glycosylase/8-oxoguanine DNA glycosylase